MATLICSSKFVNDLAVNVVVWRMNHAFGLWPHGCPMALRNQLKRSTATTALESPMPLPRLPMLAQRGTAPWAVHHSPPLTYAARGQMQAVSDGEGRASGLLGHEDSGPSDKLLHRCNHRSGNGLACRIVKCFSAPRQPADSFHLSAAPVILHLPRFARPEKLDDYTPPHPHGLPHLPPAKYR